MTTAPSGSETGYQTGVSRYIDESSLTETHRYKGPDDKSSLLSHKPGFSTVMLPSARIAEQTGLPHRHLPVSCTGPHARCAIPVSRASRRLLTRLSPGFRSASPLNRRAFLVAATRERRAKWSDHTVSPQHADDVVTGSGYGRVGAISLAPSSRKPFSGRSLDVFRMKWNIDRPYVLAGRRTGAAEPAAPAACLREDQGQK